MTAALLGVVGALGWGVADFVARFTGRALGPLVALTGMFAVGGLSFAVYAWVVDLPLVWNLAGCWLLLLTGVGTMVATLLLYRGLARGPVSLVSPIVGGYPALNVAFEVTLGARPSLAQWLAMAAVMLGVAIVARSARSFEVSGGYSRRALATTIVISLASALAFAVTVAAAQHATPIYGALQTVMIARWIGLGCCLVALVVTRRAPRLPVRWWPALVFQGLCDAAGYVSLLVASAGGKEAIAAVVVSTFSAVTVVLARVVLREAMTGAQWAGIVLIVTSVATLAGAG